MHTERGQNSVYWHLRLNGSANYVELGVVGGSFVARFARHDVECTDSLAGCTMFSAPPHCPEIEVKGCAAKTGCATAGLLATVVRRPLVYR